MGSGSALPNCHASPPSWSFTSLGASSWYLAGRWFFQMSGGSRMCVSAEMISYVRAISALLFRPRLALCFRLVPRNELAVLHVATGFVVGLGVLAHRLVALLV